MGTLSYRRSYERMETFDTGDLIRDGDLMLQEVFYGNWKLIF